MCIVTIQRGTESEENMDNREFRAVERHELFEIDGGEIRLIDNSVLVIGETLAEWIKDLFK